MTSPTGRAVQERLPGGDTGVRAGERFVPLDCTGCSLARHRTQVVPAEGGLRPLAFFVGEAPGPDEDAQGRPFIGRAGKILRRALAEAGWSDEEAWITNAVKCFPHEMEGDRRRIRRPQPDEVTACQGHLRSEVGALKPRLAVALGKTAAEALLERPIAKLESLRGPLQRSGPGLGTLPVFVTYHPSGLHYGHATLEEFTDDLRRARALALGPAPE